MPERVRINMNVKSHVLSFNSSGVKFDGTKYSGSGPALTLLDTVSTLVSECNPGQDGFKNGKTLHERTFSPRIMLL